MNSDRIAHRITDLLKLTGVSGTHAVEELTDHYLSHIEEEIRRGVNSQQAVRETYQEIANLDTSQFADEKKRQDKRGLFLLFVIFMGISFYFFQPKSTSSQTQQDQKESVDITLISPPTGSPILQTDLDVSSEFGLGLHPIAQQRELHKGIDIRANIGTYVLATGNGKVMETGYKSKAGNYIIIHHDGNFITKYYHLSEIKVKADEIVKEGQEIGKVGNSGLSMMPHLHYEVLKDEVPMNPREYIEP